MLIEYTKFYYQALSEDKQRIYKKMYEGIKSRKKSIEIVANKRNISGDDLFKIAEYVYNDTPSFYYLDATRFTFAETLLGYVYFPKYIESYSEDMIKKYDAALEKGLKIFCSRYITPTMSDYDKIKVIHDYLVTTVTYDHESLTGRVDRNGDPYNIIGPILKKRAVCWGIACAFKLLCDYCRVKSFVITGNAIPADGDAGHAWNIVKIDDKTYHVDATWDLRQKGDVSISYDYFNLDDKLIGKDHTWNKRFYPKCDEIKHNYYFKNQLFVKTLDQLSDFVADRLSKKETFIAVKFANTWPSDKEIAKAIERGFLKARKYCTYSYSFSKGTNNVYVEIK